MPKIRSYCRLSDHGLKQNARSSDMFSFSGKTKSCCNPPNIAGMACGSCRISTEAAKKGTPRSTSVRSRSLIIRSHCRFSLQEVAGSTTIELAGSRDASLSRFQFHRRIAAQLNNSSRTPNFARGQNRDASRRSRPLRSVWRNVCAGDTHVGAPRPGSLILSC